MGRSFNFYTFSLDFFYNEVLGSKNQDFIERANKNLLDWNLQFWEENMRNIGVDLYYYQLNLIVNEGKYESDDFPWDKYTFKREVEGEEKGLEYATKIDSIVALFTLQPESYGFGGHHHEYYKILFANIEKVLPEPDQEARIWNLLLNGRPLSGDQIYHSDDWYSYYGYLTHAEAKQLFISVELIKNPEGRAKLAQLPETTFLINDYKNPDLEVLDFEIRELSTGKKDLFFHIS